MKLLGIVSEYNPFHKGHKFHIENAREKSGCDGVVAVMSGNYVQRGEGALFEKSVRAKAAVDGGVDLVLELSPFFSLSSAEKFSFSAVKILSSISEVKFLSFGAESTNLKLFDEAAELLFSEPEEYKEALKESLKSGMSFASAREAAFRALGKEQLLPLISSPNNILGVEYLKALKKLNSDIQPVIIKREGSAHDSLLKTDMPSASYLREKFLCGDTEEFLRGIPSDFSGEKFFDKEAFEKMILSKIILMDKEELKEIDGISEGLENRIKEMSRSAESLEELMELVKSKRFAYSRIKRSLVSAGLGIKKEEISPMYAKVLCFNENGQKILNKIKKTSEIPIVKNMTAIKKLKDETLIKMWEKEVSLDKIYELYLKKGCYNEEK